MKPIPLFGNGVYAGSAVVTAQRRLNCYYDIRQDGDKTKVAVIGTPGLSLFNGDGAGLVRGFWTMKKQNLMFKIAGNTLWEIAPTGTATNRGTISNGSNIVGMSDNGVQLLIVDGTAGWIYTPSTTTLAQITSPNFPNTARTCVFNGGFFLADDPATNGKFAKSGAYDGATWGATDYGIAESNPDPLLAVDRYHGIIPLFGITSIEFWQLVGGGGFPYAPLVGATQDWGLAAIYSRVHINNTIAFLGQYDEGGFQVCVLNGYQVVPISTPDIDTIIRSFSIVADATGLGYMENGHPMYQITFPSAGRSFLYDFTTQMWSETQTGVGLTGRHIGGIGIAYNGKNYIGDYQNANVYLVDPTVYTDNGITIPRLVQTRHVYQDYNVLGVDELFLDMETGVGLQSGQGSDPQIMLSVSKDNGRTFGTERWRSMGKVGQYSGPRVKWDRFGAARDFVFRFYMTDPVKFVINSGAATLRLGKG